MGVIVCLAFATFAFAARDFFDPYTHDDRNAEREATIFAERVYGAHPAHVVCENATRTQRSDCYIRMFPDGGVAYVLCPGVDPTSDCECVLKASWP